MKVIVEKSEPSNGFDSIQVGQVFKFAGDYYLRISPTTSLNVFRLTKKNYIGTAYPGELMTFCGTADTPFIPVNAHIVVDA